MLVAAKRVHLARSHLSPLLFASQLQNSNFLGTHFIIQQQCCTTTSPNPTTPVQPPVGESATRNKFAFTHANQSTRSVIQAITGNFVITLSKFAAYAFTGSSAMLSEAIHTSVDTVNQVLLFIGVKQAQRKPDKFHNHGYGRSVYFYSFLSGVGTFCLGSGAVLIHSISTIMSGSEAPIEYGLATWATLSFAFCVDGFVLLKVLKSIRAQIQGPIGFISFLKYVRNVHDPAIQAIILEDSAACTGVLLASSGIGLSYLTGNPIWDSVASGCVGLLLGGVAWSLIRMNQQYLIGKALNREIEQDIASILKSRPSVVTVKAIQSAWEGPYSFYFKADVDFNATYIAQTLHQKYLHRFAEEQESETVKLLLETYAEDVLRIVENEVYTMHGLIRERYPEARFIELQPHCTYNKAALIDSVPQGEIDNALLYALLASLHINMTTKPTGAESVTTQTATDAIPPPR